MVIRIIVNGYNLRSFLAKNVAFKRCSNSGLNKLAQSKTLAPKISATP